MGRPDFDDQVVLVTGASSGIGAAMAHQLGRAGARVTLMARRSARLDAVVATMDCDDRVLTVVGDITDPEACRSAVESTVSRFGRLDWVIANAGASMNARFEDAELDVFRQMMDVNYFGALYMAKFAQPHLARSGGGLVFVSSIVGKRGFATRSGYSASKFAVHALFESLRVEWADSGIHVGIVAPGYTRTEIRQHALGPDGRPRLIEGATAGSVMSAEAAATAILTAAAQRRREVILTTGGKAMVWLNKFLPRVADRVAARVVG